MERHIILMETTRVGLMKKSTTYMNIALKILSSIVMKRKIKCMITSHPKKSRRSQRL